MQKNKRTRTSEESASIVYGVLDGGQNRSTNCQKGNNRNVLPRGAKGIAQRRNRHPLLSEDGASSGQRIYNNTKLCVICGSSEEIVDLSTNPIMRKTMASYCGNDNLVSKVVEVCKIKIKATAFILLTRQPPWSAASPRTIQYKKKFKPQDLFIHVCKK
ncbi:uncharacterized protein LOC118745191 [Rhagoletis pomonella]|uniref:uncharacterized protein LOC118745191 n=1 Tax=Rhagoletis pomonella TaxID=28610 RepID=UPI001787362D|nr:uncharacterized protein LOC118745191 [Rhagoletis pomonella]